MVIVIKVHANAWSELDAIDDDWHHYLLMTLSIKMVKRIHPDQPRRPLNPRRSLRRQPKGSVP